MTNLFVYGTLMDPEIMEHVAGERFESEPALLKNYGRFRVIDEMFPAIVAKPLATIEGRLYRNVKPKALSYLDEFELILYNRQTVTVHLQNHTKVVADAYILMDEHREKLSKDIWTLEWFLEHGKEAFRSRYEGFSNIKR